VILKTKSKIYKLLLIGFLLCLGIGLILYGASNTITFFYTPSKLLNQNMLEKTVRLGGIVKPNTTKYLDINSITFVVTDNENDIQVEYTGMIPKLFRDSQGIVLKGKLLNNIFIASEILAKHDETYTPTNQIEINHYSYD
jgi:cytochrome c-type biogenesis protein CcmE